MTEDEEFQLLEAKLKRKQGGYAHSIKTLTPDEQEAIDERNASIRHNILTANAKLAANDKQVGGDHYKKMGVQTWDVVGTWPIEQQIGYYRGNALKYIMRCGSKDDRLQEIKKAGHYVDKLIEILEKEHNRDNAGET